MTFKHTKFSESQVMKSFEKLAFEKGLVTAEPVVKVASQKKSSLAPTKDLMINILKLCSGLRANGFDKVANDLENNFLNYKRADNFYETSKETGEDLVDEAHPDGSHKMEGMQGDATFETIVDQKEIIRKKIDKMPTGKLTTAGNIMNAVKNALGQTGAGGAPAEGQDEQEKQQDDNRKNEEGVIQKAAIAKLSLAVNYVNDAKKTFDIKSDLSWINPNRTSFNSGIKSFNEIGENAISNNLIKVSDFKYALDLIGYMKKSVSDPTFGISEPGVLNAIRKDLSRAEGAVNLGLNILLGKNSTNNSKSESTNTTTTNNQSSDKINEIQNLFSKINVMIESTNKRLNSKVPPLAEDKLAKWKSMQVNIGKGLEKASTDYNNGEYDRALYELNMIASGSWKNYLA